MPWAADPLQGPRCRLAGLVGVGVAVGVLRDVVPRHQAEPIVVVAHALIIALGQVGVQTAYSSTCRRSRRRERGS
jgi:hypothetical protein